MKVEASQETVGVKKRVSFKPQINSTASVISHNKSILLESYCTISNETPSLEDVHSVEEYEVYLQKYSTSRLREGDYHNEVPKDLQDEWTKLFDKRAEQVRESTRHFWKNYQRYAYGCDELAPVSKGCKNNWGGVGMTLIDSLDTLWIMDMKEEFEEAVGYVIITLDLRSRFIHIFTSRLIMICQRLSLQSVFLVGYYLVFISVMINVC